MAIVSSFLTYFIEAALLVAVAIAGVFLGKFLRKKKDAKDALGRKDSE